MSATNGHVEKHEWQFRDQSIPAWVCHKIQGIKNLTMNDMLLCFVINSLVRAQSEKSGRGCFASDTYLGKAIHLHPINVNKRLHWLQEVGLVLILAIDKQRYLETIWSRAAGEITEMEGAYGKAFRRAWRKYKKQASDVARVSEFAKQPISEFANLPPSDVAKQSILIKTKDKERKNNSPPANGVRSEADRLWGYCQCVGDKAASMLKRKGIINFIQIGAWAKQIKLLVTEDGYAEEFVEGVIDWYVRHHGEEFVPEIYNASQLRSKFSQIAGAKKRGSRIDGEQLKPPHTGVC